MRLALPAAAVGHLDAIFDDGAAALGVETASECETAEQTK